MNYITNYYYMIYFHSFRRKYEC